MGIHYYPISFSWKKVWAPQIRPLLSTITQSHSPGKKYGRPKFAHGYPLLSHLILLEKSMGAPNSPTIIHYYPISFSWKKVWAPQIRPLLSTIIPSHSPGKKYGRPKFAHYYPLLSHLILLEKSMGAPNSPTIIHYYPDSFSWKKVWAPQIRPLLSTII